MVKSNSSEEKILTYLIENKEKLSSIRNISKECKINYKSAYVAVNKLYTLNLIDFKITDNSKFCFLTKDFSPLIFQVEYNRRVNFIKQKKLQVLVKYLENINVSLIALVFGSQVKGTSTKTSDIDLMVVSENEKKIDEELKLLPLNLHITYLSYNEFISMNKSQEFSVVSEAIKKNIILVGIEEYYRLLKNA